jgi:hypothetical protein
VSAPPYFKAKTEKTLLARVPFFFKQGWLTNFENTAQLLNAASARRFRAHERGAIELPSQSRSGSPAAGFSLVRVRMLGPLRNIPNSQESVPNYNKVIFISLRGHAMKTISPARRKLRALWLGICLALVGAVYWVMLSGFVENVDEFLD